MLILLLATFQVIAQSPTTPAATPPTRNSANVISIYSGAYTNLTGTDFNPNWGQAGFGAATEITVSGDQIRSYPGMNYQGIQFASPINLASMDSLHLDIWTPNCTSFDIYLVAGSGAGEKLVNKTLTLSGWNSVNIKLSEYSSQGLPMGNIIQFKFVAVTPASGANMFIDNMYFYTNASLPTLSNFNIPAKFVGDAPFTLTAPTSNSSGAFSYSSSNTGVATISGNTVTIVGVGTSTITATQAAAGSYSSGTITANLVVTYPPLTVAAPVPTRAAANVKSLYSDTYPNVAGIDWNPFWGQTTIATEVSISGNATRKYESLNYQGTQLSAALNMSAASHLHLDLYSPNCTQFKISLIKTTGGTSEIPFTITPTLNSWNSIDIPLTAFSPAIIASVEQIKIEGLPASSALVYLDNIYFWHATNVLPVSLAEFSATKENKTVNLSWVTLTENNNKGFEVQRSIDAKTWETIRFVNGVGNASTKTNYSSVDENPFKGTNFYRLNQIDFDGKSTYSKVVSVRFTESLGLNFFPNPAKEKVVILVDEIEHKNASIDFINLQGKVIKTIALTDQQSNSNLIVDVSSFSKGMYIVKLNNGSVIKTNKLIIN